MKTITQLILLVMMLLQSGCALTYSLIEDSQERRVLRDTYHSIDQAYVGTNGVVTLHVTGHPVKLPKGEYTLLTNVAALEAVSDTVYVSRDSLHPGWIKPVGEVEPIPSDNETFRHGHSLSALRPHDGEKNTVYFWPERRFVFTQADTSSLQPALHRRGRYSGNGRKTDIQTRVSSIYCRWRRLDDACLCCVVCRHVHCMELRCPTRASTITFQIALRTV